MNEDKPEVSRGHLEDCFKHFSSALLVVAPKGSAKAAQTKKLLADFCGVTVNAVNRWLNGLGFLPNGQALIRLMFYLDMIGYKIIELERMPKVCRNFSELVGFSLLDSEEAAKLLDYPKAGKFYDIFFNRQGTGTDRDQKMWDGWKEKKEALLLQKEKANELYYIDVRPRPQSSSSKLVNERSSVVVPTSRYSAIVRIMEGLLLLLEEGGDHKLTQGELDSLQPSGNTMVQLLAHLSALSSQLVMSHQQKGGG